MFESSWALLTPVEQAQLASISVFLGPFSERSAEAITEATLYELQILVEKSLLQKQGDRFALHPLLRQFAAEKLANFPENKVTVRHSHYYLQAVADLGAALNGEMPQLAVQRIAGAWANVKGAGETAVAGGNWDRLLSALIPLSDFCQIRGLYREGLRLFGRAAERLRQIETETAKEDFAHFLAQQAAMLVRLSDYPQAIQSSQQAAALTTNNWLAARLLITQGEALWRQGEFVQAESFLNQAQNLAQSISNEKLLGLTQFHLGVIYLFKGENLEAQQYLNESLAVWRRQKNRRWQGFTLISLGSVATRLGKFEEALSYLTEALRINEGNGDQQGQILALTNLGLLATEQKAFEQARRHFQQALARAQATGDRNNQALQLYNLAWCAKEAQEWPDAEHFANKALVLLKEVKNSRGIGLAHGLLGDVAAANGRSSLARQHYQTSLTISEEIGYKQMVDYLNKALHELRGGEAKKEAND